VTEEDGAGEVVPDSPKKQGITAQPRRTVSSYARSEVPVVRATLPGEELLSGRQGVGTDPKTRKSADRNGAATSILDTPEGEGGAPAALFQTGASSSTKPRDLSMFTRRFHLKKTTSTLPTSRGPTSGIQKRKKGQRPDIAVFVEKAREPKKHDSHLTGAHRGTDSHASLKVRSDGVPVVQLNLARPRKRPGQGTRAVVKKRGGAEQGGRQDLHPTVAALPETHDSTDTEPELRDRGPSQLAEDLHRSTLQPSTFQHALDSATRLDVRPPASNPRETPTTAPPRTSRPPPPHPHPHLPKPSPPSPASAPPLAALALALTPPRAKTKVPPVDFANPYPYGPETMPSKDAPAGGDSGEENEDDYVYDTYVRQATTHAGHAMPTSGEDVDVANRKIGIIVITQEDEKLWETYGVDEGRDEGWDSEDEDENGMSLQKALCLCLCLLCYTCLLSAVCCLLSAVCCVKDGFGF